MSPDDRVRLLHMVEAAESAQGFIKGRDRTDLDTDRMLVFALVRAIEIIGEAAARVSPEGRDEIPGIPWSRIVGMRNRLIHAYFEVDAEILWNTATEALPELIGRIKPVL